MDRSRDAYLASSADFFAGRMTSRRRESLGSRSSNARPLSLIITSITYKAYNKIHTYIHTYIIGIHYHSKHQEMLIYSTKRVHRPVSSVGRVADYRAGGRGFKPWPDQH